MNDRMTAKELFHLHYKTLKATRKEYIKQNADFVKILQFYASDYDDGFLAKTALQAWFKRLSEEHPLEKEFMEEFNRRKQTK